MKYESAKTEHGNIGVSWVSQELADAQAAEMDANGNKDCYNCSGCSDCSDCSGCSGCSDCSDCSGCSGCSRCSGCSDCSYCSGCSGCSDCSDCSGCSGCSRCSGCSDCSDCSDCSGCSDCSDCSRCSGCSDCSRCSGCSGCSRCSDCSDCSDCSHVAHLYAKEGLQGNPDATGPTGAPKTPIIENIHQRVYEAASKPDALDMGSWHRDGFCGTTHCRAGWVVHLAGEEGRALERFHDTPLAALLIYHASSPNLPVSPTRFYEDNETAMADMKRLADLEAAA